MKESVSGILVFENEVFIIKRQNFLKAFPGYFSFPGGKVDEEDKALTPTFTVDGIESYLLSALSRELKEELNFCIETEYSKGNIKKISRKGIAITPDFNPHRFKNHYFKIHINRKVEFKVDEGEAAFHGWMQVKEAFKMYQDSKMLVVPPMITLLEDLAKDIDNDEEIDPNLKYDGESQVPLIHPLKDIDQFLPLSNTFPPAKRTNCFYIGDEKKILIDPSPASESEYEKLLQTLAKRSIDLIFLTHHHPDHHEYATKLALEKSLPMGMSEDTFKRITLKYGEDYFKGIEIEYYKDGDILTRCHKQEVIIIHTPGHDEGQLSLYRKDMAWMIVSDLIQTIGTVVVGNDEGDMNKYFRSLEKVIKLNPQVVFPSHGIGIGGINKLSETLKHRLEREKQVKALMEAGNNKEQMLKSIYPDLPQRLHPYALSTIEAHIEKLNTVGMG